MTLQEFFRSLMYIAITAVLPLLAKLIDQYVQQFIADKQSDADTKVVADAVDTVYSVVSQVNQTYTDSVKASGRFDKTAQQRAKETALTTAKELISAESKVIIGKLYNNFDLWLDTQIEAMVKAQKNTEAVVK